MVFSLKEYKDVFDFVFVVPYGVDSGSNTFFSSTPETTDSTLRGEIYSPSYTSAAFVPTLHEMGHAWNVHLGSLFNNAGPNGHWLFTGLDKHGQLGGFDRTEFQCVDPAGLMPTSTQTCNVDSTTSAVHLQTIPWSAGSPYTSHDAIGNYAKLELVAMGLMTAAELADTPDAEAPFCVQTNEQFQQTSSVSEGLANIQCEKIEFITAQMVEDISIANFDRISRDQALRAVIVVVMDGDTSGVPPTTLSGLEGDARLNWWNEYSKRMPDFWYDATYQRSTLSLSVTDADKGCGVTVACPVPASPTASPTATPTASPTTSPTTAPTAAPTAAPTPAPTAAPTSAPTHDPTTAPTVAPTAAPTSAPTVVSVLNVDEEDK